MVAIATPSAARIEREPTTPLYELIRDVAALAALPRACLRVMEIGDKQRGAAREMVEVITCDPALTRQLLKLINSAYCGFPQPVAHLADAVELIGTRRLRNLTLAAGALSAFNGITTPLLDRKAFWHASVHCGLMARALARIARHQQTDRLFTVGLLHRIGQLVMHQDPARARRMQDPLKSNPSARATAEVQVFGFTYCEVGAALLETWQLPASMWMPIRYHCTPAGATDFRTDTALLTIALAVTDSVAPSLIPLTLAERREPRIEPVAWLQCGLSADVLAAAIQEVDTQWAAVSAALKSDATPPP